MLVEEASRVPLYVVTFEVLAVGNENSNSPVDRPASVRVPVSVSVPTVTVPVRVSAIRPLTLSEGSFNINLIVSPIPYEFTSPPADFADCADPL